MTNLNDDTIVPDLLCLMPNQLNTYLAVVYTRKMSVLGGSVMSDRLFATMVMVDCEKGDNDVLNYLYYYYSKPLIIINYMI